MVVSSYIRDATDSLHWEFLKGFPAHPRKAVNAKELFVKPTECSFANNSSDPLHAGSEYVATQFSWTPEATNHRAISAHVGGPF